MPAESSPPAQEIRHGEPLEMAASSGYTKLSAELRVPDLFPEAAVMQVEVVEERLRRRYISTRRCRVWWRPLHPLGCTWMASYGQKLVTA